MLMYGAKDFILKIVIINIFGCWINEIKLMQIKIG